jgi:Family of unknown function (DUF5670)
MDVMSPADRKRGASQGAAELAHAMQVLESTRPVGRRRDTAMLWTIFVILLVLWLLGMVSSYTLGGFIHILLVLALVVILINVIQGRRPVA